MTYEEWDELNLRKFYVHCIKHRKKYSPTGFGECFEPGWPHHLIWYTCNECQKEWEEEDWRRADDTRRT